MRCHDGQGRSTHCRATPLVSRGISNLPHLGSIWTPSHLSDTTYVEHRMLAQSGYFSAFTRLAPHITTAQELKREFNTGGSSATTSSDVENVYKVRSSGPHQHGRCLPLPHDFEAAGLGPCIKNRRGFHSTNDMTNHHADERETGIWADNAFTELSSSSCA